MNIPIAGIGHDTHDTGPHHPERHARLDAAMAGVTDVGVSVSALAPRVATRAELRRVHTAEYLDSLEAFCAAGGGKLDQDSPVVPGSWETALEAAGAGLAAVDAAASGVPSFVIARPPGHHASAARGMGFCLFNNVAVAAASLLEAGERVAIVDWDVHHGNGTQDIFWDEPRVVFVSTHQSPFYPGTGSLLETGGPSAPGTTVNIPLPAGATGDVVLEAIDTVAAPVIAALDPTWVLISAGYDAHRDDPLADLRLTAGDFADLTARVVPMAPRAVLFLEGGYDLAALRLSVGATVATLAGADYRPEPASNGGPGHAQVQAARAVHARLRDGT